MPLSAVRAALTTAAVWYGLVPVMGQPPALREVLERAVAYVHQFERQLSEIVAEETYEQVVSWPPLAPPENAPTIQRRILKSDLFLLRPERGFNWVQLRDVFEKDGTPVRDREARLTGPGLRASVSTPGTVNRIRRESARYNIGSVDRTMNVPVLPLAVLDGKTKPRFRFRRERNADGGTASALPGDDLPASSHFRVSTELWVVSFEERDRPTLVRTPSGKDLFSRGRFWIEPDTGRVRMAEMWTESRDVRAQLTVSYQSEPVLGFLVPIEMRERYDRLRDGSVIEGTASYGRFRQLQLQRDGPTAPDR